MTTNKKIYDVIRNLIKTDMYLNKGLKILIEPMPARSSYVSKLGANLTVNSRVGVVMWGRWFLKIVLVDTSTMNRVRSRTTTTTILSLASYEWINSRKTWLREKKIIQLLIPCDSKRERRKDNSACIITWIDLQEINSLIYRH